MNQARSRLTAAVTISVLLATPAIASAADANSKTRDSAPRSFAGKFGSLQVYTGTKFRTGTSTTTEGTQHSTSGRSWGIRWVRWNAQPAADGSVREKNLTFTRAKTLTTGAAPSSGEKNGSRTFWVRGGAPDHLVYKRSGSVTETVSTEVSPAGHVVSATKYNDTKTGSTTGTEVKRDTNTGREVRTTKTADSTTIGLAQR